MTPTPGDLSEALDWAIKLEQPTVSIADYRTLDYEERQVVVLAHFYRQEHDERLRVSELLHKTGEMVIQRDIEIAGLKESMVAHFNRDHLAGDGPEIDRWKLANAALVKERDAMRATLRNVHAEEGGCPANNYGSECRCGAEVKL